MFQSFLRNLGCILTAIIGIGGIYLVETFTNGWASTLFGSTVALLFLVIAPACWLWFRWISWRKGFHVHVLRGREKGEEVVVYTERVGGQLLEHHFGYGERDGFPKMVIVPEADKWDSLLPPWLHGRQEEIAARIRSVLTPPKFIICDYDGNPI